MSDDSQLLRQFAANRSEAAFGELVARHVALVYSAAFRQTNGDAHLAQDIAQVVFADFARKAPALSENVVLAGWLHRATIFAARQILRTERRRRSHEQQAVTMSAIPSENENSDWRQIRPLLDEALNRLNKTDRDALLLRFFENQSLAQVGINLGTAEDAARKRVNRALEKLRKILARRGVTTTAATLSTVISANAIQIAPAGLAATLATTSIATAGTGTTFTLLKIMTATKLKLAFSVIVVAGAATAIVIQQQNQTKLRGENESFQQQIAQLQTDNANYSNRLAEVGDDKKLSDEQFSELLKLRGEVGVLQRQLDEAVEKNRALQNAAMVGSNTNSSVPQIHIKACFFSMPKDVLAGLGNLNGILTSENASNTLWTVKTRNGVKELAEPEVVTTSGRDTQMRVTQTISVVTNFCLQETNGVSSISPQTGTVEIGPILDIVPRILSDGYTIELRAIPSLTDFLGYVQSTNTTPAYTTDGQEIDLPTASPQFRIQQTTNSMNLLDGQTMVFAMNDKQAPADATFLQSDGSTTRYDDKQTLVFITATIVDSMGKRIHDDAGTYTKADGQ
ncbi:MAG TPA: sigma-70 family RNA polymerase sigma factor [Verrucomicrobiae bacterium]|nr:sigma-70 family RNA polymerase sigma factor [Verrucomicrobiae bacterium]